MPFILIIIGLMFTIAGVRGQETQLLSLLESDFTGDGSFKGSYLAWIVAIGALGALGYIKKIQPIANAFMGLVIVVLFLSNKGFFTQFYSQVQQLASSSGSSSGTSSSSATNGLPSLGFSNAPITQSPSLFSSLSSLIPSLSGSSTPSTPTAATA